MCQQQFEAEFMAEKWNNEQSMAKTIAQQSLERVRCRTNPYMNEWYDGRASASALIYPCPETLAAKNEIRFLCGVYARRHRGVL